MKNKDYEKIQKFVYEYKTKHSKGFTPEEIEDVKTRYPKINDEKFDSALMGITGRVYGGGVFVIYHCDVLKAIVCGLENRELNEFEFD